MVSVHSSKTLTKTILGSQIAWTWLHVLLPITGSIQLLIAQQAIPFHSTWGNKPIISGALIKIPPQVSVLSPITAT